MTAGYKQPAAYLWTEEFVGAILRCKFSCVVQKTKRESNRQINTITKETKIELMTGKLFQKEKSHFILFYFSNLWRNAFRQSVMHMEQLGQKHGFVSLQSK